MSINQHPAPSVAIITTPHLYIVFVNYSNEHFITLCDLTLLRPRNRMNDSFLISNIFREGETTLPLFRIWNFSYHIQGINQKWEAVSFAQRDSFMGSGVYMESGESNVRWNSNNGSKLIGLAESLVTGGC